MLVPLCLYRAQRRRLQRIVARSRDHLLVQRARILLLVWELRLVCLVVERAGCARASVYRTVAAFRARGEDSLLDGRSLRPPQKVLPLLLTLLVEYLSRPPSTWGWHRSSWTLALLREQLRLGHGLLLSKTLLWMQLRRLEYRRLRPRPALRIPVAGRRATIRRLRTLARHSSPRAPVFYVDEADLDLNPRIGAVWARRGRQPLVLTPGQNRKHYFAGALCAHSGALLVCDGPRKTSALFLALFEQLLVRYAHGPTLHLILDNFIIHKSRQVQRFLAAHPGRFQLHFLPPYSPEENRIEHVWKQLHDHVTRCHRYPRLRELVRAANHFLRHCQPFPGSGVGLLRSASSGVSGGLNAI